MQVAYVGTLLQGAVQLWFQRENNVGTTSQDLDTTG